MRPGLTISTVAHTLLLAWGLVTFSSRPFEAAPSEMVPVDIISPTEFSQLTAGQDKAKPADVPKPLVEKIGEDKPVKDPTPKVVEKKPEIQTASAEATPPSLPEAKPKETKAEDKKPEPKTDQIAEALKKEEAKKPDPPKPAPAKKPQPKLDMSQIENKLALLDKREQRRDAATGSTLNAAPSLGVQHPNSTATLTQNEIAALQARLRECWDVPVGVADARDLSVLVRIQFRPDGSLATEPMVTNQAAHPMFQIAAESALRAVRKCAPYSFMPRAKYDAWKDVEVNFDPRDMFRG